MDLLTAHERANQPSVEKNIGGLYSQELLAGLASPHSGMTEAEEGAAEGQDKLREEAHRVSKPLDAHAEAGVTWSFLGAECRPVPITVQH